jgi:hypothetical protein
MKFPQFVPILTAFTARVAGREGTELMQSPNALARALADTQTVVGHDGVLSIFDPLLLSSACIRKQGEMNSTGEARGTGLTLPDEILQTAPLATLLESIQPLRHLLPDRAMIFTTFSGPGLLYSQLQDTFASCGMTGTANSDYVHDVILSVVRSSLELKADGIALIEQTAPGIPPEMQRCHKTVRKLADFYDAGFLVFRLPGTEDGKPAIPAHCVFDLAPSDNFIGPIFGRLESSAASNTPPVTTAGDVPENTPVEKLKNL